MSTRRIPAPPKMPSPPHNRRSRLPAIKVYPTPSVLLLYRGPLAKLAWVFGWRRPGD